MTPTLHFNHTTYFPLSYNKETKTFLIDASDLPDQDATPIRNYVFYTFWIYSTKTGVRKLFTLAHTERQEGDVPFWEYHNPEGFILRVYND